MRCASPRSLTYRKHPSRKRGCADESRPMRCPMTSAWCRIRSLDGRDDLLHGCDDAVAADDVRVVAHDERLCREDHRHLRDARNETRLADDLRRTGVAHELDDLHG